MTNKKVLVLDIDETLSLNYLPGEEVFTLNPKYLIHFYLEPYGAIRQQFFDPSWLFKLKEDHPDLRIVFFSAGKAERNHAVIKEWLSKHSSQVFDYSVFSAEHLHFPWSSEPKKDLKQVLLEGESLDDVIFVDDNWRYWIEGQGTFIKAKSLESIRFITCNRYEVFESAMKHIEDMVYNILGDAGDSLNNHDN